MKKILFITAGVALSGFTYAQSLSPQVTASAGTSYSSASSQLEFTIGEPLTTSLSAGGNIVTQGFNQPEIQLSSIQNYHSGFTFNLYPNPTEQYITIESSKESDMQIRINDINGKSILVSNVFQQKITLDVQTLAAGTYVLNIVTKEGTMLHSYRVVKK